LLIRGVGGDVSCHPAPGEGADAVGTDVVAGHVERDRLGQCHDPELGGGIVGLPDIAHQARGTGHVDIGPRFLLPEQRRRGAADEKRAVEMDVQHREPLLRLHLVEHRVPQDAGIVDHDVELAEAVDGGADDALRRVPVRDRVGADRSLTAEAPDLVAGVLGRRV